MYGGLTFPLQFFGLRIHCCVCVAVKLNGGVKLETRHRRQKEGAKASHHFKGRIQFFTIENFSC